ncbi:reverse transcriptase domain-containing protein [Tanacetum coccineum]
MDSFSRALSTEEGMFLGYKDNTKGITVCADKVDAFLSLPSLKCLKDVQKLNGKLESLNSDFHWIEEAESAFKQMKQLIAELPTLTAPEEKEELIVYLAAAKKAVSAVLMTEREAKQMPIYFVSRALRGPKVNYTSMEKLVLALAACPRDRQGSPNLGLTVWVKPLLWTNGYWGIPGAPIMWSCLSHAGSRRLIFLSFPLQIASFLSFLWLHPLFTAFFCSLSASVSFLPPGDFGSLDLPDTAAINPALEATSLPKFDMHLYKSSLTETNVKWLTKCYGILADLHPRVPPEGMTMDVLPADAIGLYAHHF